MQYIYAIHGAFSSPTIFNYIKQNLDKQYSWQFLDYQTATGGFFDIVKRIPLTNQPCHVIGHSMGGLMALAIAKLPWVKTITTISAPLGGTDVNPIAQYWSRSEFIADIAGSTKLVHDLAALSTMIPIQHLISNKGFNPWIYEPNDGVVTLKSQRAYSLGRAIEIPSNHAEIMLNDQTVISLKEFWAQT